MSIDTTLERIASALERIADSATPVAADAKAASAPVAAPAQETKPKKGPGRPRKVAPAQPATVEPEPAVPSEKDTASTVAAVASPEPAPAPTVAEQPGAAPSDEGAGSAAAEPAGDDFLDDEPREYKIEDVRAALKAYADRIAVTEGMPAGMAKARALLKEVSGVETLTAFTDTTRYAALIKKASQ